MITLNVSPCEETVKRWSLSLITASQTSTCDWSDEFDTSHAECRIHLFFRSEGDSGFRVQIDPCSHIDKYWLQAAILVMSRQLFDSCCARGVMKLS